MHKFDALNDLQLRNILLATDFSPASDAAFHAALRLCGACQANLHVLNVFEYETIPPSDQGGQRLESDSFRQSAELCLDSLIQ